MLDIADAQDSFKVINEDQCQQMLFGIFLFIRRREQVVFRIIIDRSEFYRPDNAL